jgi:hypothetical protein
MDSFILLRILHYLPIVDFLSVSLTSRKFNDLVRDIIQKNVQYNAIHHFHKLGNDLQFLSSLTAKKRLFNTTLKKCDSLCKKATEELKDIKRTLYIHRKYNKHFYNKENDLIFTLEKHQLSKLYSEWKCITHPIELHFHEQPDKSWKISFCFDADSSDKLLLRFFEFELDGFANVDNIGENIEILANPKHLDKVEKVYSTRGAKMYFCNLFIWFKPKQSMPPNDTHFVAIVEEDDICKKPIEFQVKDDYLYSIDTDDKDEELIKFFHRREWKEKWNPMWPVHDVHYCDEC